MHAMLQKAGMGGRFAPEPGAWARQCMTDWRTDDDDGSLGKATNSSSIYCAHPPTSAACHGTPSCDAQACHWAWRASIVRLFYRYVLQY
jgi:hypothetical protein